MQVVNPNLNIIVKTLAFILHRHSILGTHKQKQTKNKIAQYLATCQTAADSKGEKKDKLELPDCFYRSWGQKFQEWYKTHTRGHTQTRSRFVFIALSKITH